MFGGKFSQTLIFSTAGLWLLISVLGGNRSTWEIGAESSPLAQAARAGDLSLVEIALKNGADVNQRDPEMGNTSLHWATGLESHSSYPTKQRLAIVHLLLAKGADPNLENSSGEAPLYRAVWSPELTAALLKGGANVEKGVVTRTPLLSAAYLGGNMCFDAAESMKILIASGANVKAQEGGGWSALVVATVYGCPDMVRLLLDAGADPNAKTNLGETVLGSVQRFEKIEGEYSTFLTKPDPAIRKQSVALIRRAGGHL